MKKDGILGKILNYRVKTDVTVDNSNIAVTMAIVGFFVLLGFYGYKLINKST